MGEAAQMPAIGQAEAVDAPVVQVHHVQLRAVGRQLDVAQAGLAHVAPGALVRVVVVVGVVGDATGRGDGEERFHAAAVHLDLVHTARTQGAVVAVALVVGPGIEGVLGGVVAQAVHRPHLAHVGDEEVAGVVGRVVKGHHRRLVVERVAADEESRGQEGVLREAGRRVRGLPGHWLRRCRRQPGQKAEHEHEYNGRHSAIGPHGWPAIRRGEVGQIHDILRALTNRGLGDAPLRRSSRFVNRSTVPPRTT